MLYYINSMLYYIILYYIILYHIVSPFCFAPYLASLRLALRTVLFWSRVLSSRAAF